MEAEESMKVFKWKGSEDQGRGGSPAGGAGVPSLDSSDVSSEESAANGRLISKQKVPPGSPSNWHVEVEKPRGGNKIGNIVRKLNCSESRKGRFDATDDAMNAGQPYSYEYTRSSSAAPKSWKGFWKGKEDTNEDFRPVLITVEDTPVFMQPPRTPSRLLQRRSRSSSPSPRYYSPQHGSPGVLISSTPTKPGLIKQPTGKISAEFFDQYRYPAPPQTPRSTRAIEQGTGSQPKHVTWPSDVVSSKRSPSYIGTNDHDHTYTHAEKEFWYRSKGHPVLQDDNDSTANSRSVMTGLDTMGTGTSDDYTGYSSVSESEDPSEIMMRRRSRRISAGCSRNRLPSSETGLLAGVAEDLGVVAGMILMDGNACFTCVAETTKESVAECGSGRPRRYSSSKAKR